jgi:hypothetical protein
MGDTMYKDHLDILCLLLPLCLVLGHLIVRSIVAIRSHSLSLYEHTWGKTIPQTL